MKKALLVGIFLICANSLSAQVAKVDPSDSSIIVVGNYNEWDYWKLYPETSSVPRGPDCGFYQFELYNDTLSKNHPNFCAYKSFIHVKRNGLHGIISDSSDIIIPLEYDTLHRIINSSNRSFIAKKNGKYGLLNCKNELVIPFEYDEMRSLGYGRCCDHVDNTLAVVKNGKKGLVRTDGSIKLSCSFDFIDNPYGQYGCPTFDKNYYVGKKGKCGYIDLDENVIIDIKYDYLKRWEYSNLFEASLDGKVGAIDSNQVAAIPFQYEDLNRQYMWPFHNLVAFKENGKWGMMHGPNDNAQILISAKFDSIFTVRHFEKYFAIIKNGKWGLVDTNGKVLISPQFQQIDAMEDGAFAYKQDGRWGFMNKYGKLHCSPRYDSIYDNERNWCLVTKGNGFGFCKTSGKQIAAPIYHPPIWDDYIAWSELLDAGAIWLYKGTNYDNCVGGVIDSNGVVRIPFKYDCYDFPFYSINNTDECLLVSRNGKKVLLLANGTEVAGTYDDIESNQKFNFFFKTERAGKFGLISPKGRLLASPIYDGIYPYYFVADDGSENNYFKLVKEGKTGLMNSSGKIVIPVDYRGLSIESESRVLVISDKVEIYDLEGGRKRPLRKSDILSFNGHVGTVDRQEVFIDEKGNIVNPTLYYNVYRMPSDTNYFQVYKGNRYGICDSMGREIVKPQFRKIKFWDGEFGAGKSAGNYCFFNAKGDTIVGYRYRKVKGVYRDFVCVRIGEKFGVVTKQGKTILPPTLDIKLNFNELRDTGFTTIRQSWKTGLINRDCEIILEPRYGRIDIVLQKGEDTYFLAKDDYYAVYDSTGKALSTRQYTKWEQNEIGELFLFNDYSWYRINEEGEIEEANHR